VIGGFKTMTILYVLNTAFLVLAGLAMIVAGPKLFAGGGELSIAQARAIGIGDFAMASVTGVLLATGGGRPLSALVSLGVLHVGLSVVMIVSRKTALYKAPILACHALLGLGFVLALGGVGPLSV
jgi:hypothetical protein